MKKAFHRVFFYWIVIPRNKRIPEFDAAKPNAINEDVTVFTSETTKGTVIEVILKGTII